MGQYTIRRGDTLSGIAAKNGTTVEKLMRDNPQITNPNLIRAGGILNLRDGGGSSTDTSGNTSGNASTQPTTTTADTGFEYDLFEHPDYQESDKVTEIGGKKANAEDAVADYGDFEFSKQTDWDNIYNQYKNREDFSYDFNADALYQQYKDKYIQQGKMAMADTIGQASAMTGGYGNSYAVTAGSQAYQSHLQNLNDIIPELYQLAYNKYNQEGQDMLNMLGLLDDERSFEYGAWGDKLNKLVSDRDYYGTQYDNERTWDYGQYIDGRDLAYNEHTNEQGYAYNNYRDAIEDDFTERQLTMQEEKWKLEKEAYENDGGGDNPGGNNSGGATSYYNNGNLTVTQIKQLQNAIGVTSDGFYGDASKKAAGGLTAEEAYRKYVGKLSGGFTGSTEKDAVSYMKQNGVPSLYATNLMSVDEWNRRRSSYQLFGVGSAEVTEYDSYKDYLAGIVEYRIEKYGK